MKPWIYTLFLLSLSAQAITPNAANSPWYYQLGGVHDVGLPPVQSVHTLNLEAGLKVHTGYQCGVFNPAISLTHTLNQLHDSLKNAEKTIVQNATAAVAEFPMYELARINPSLYNIFNNLILRAHTQISIATKSCRQMQWALDHGQNPYHNWASIAIGNQWKRQISLAKESGEGNITQVQSQLDTKPGEDGVPWVQGAPDEQGIFLAGGKDQPPIHLLADTMIAGYNVLLGRHANDRTPPASEDHLVKIWATPTDAAHWLTDVLGDLIITTCQSKNCPRGGKAGKGLAIRLTDCATYPNTCQAHFHHLLQPLVSGNQAPSPEALQPLSVDGLMFSPAIIDALQQLPHAQQQLMMQKLAQELALQTLVEEALLARQCLLTGSSVPAIAANGPAQQSIIQAIKHLDQSMQALRFAQKMRTQLLGQTISELFHMRQRQNQAAIPRKISP